LDGVSFRYFRQDGTPKIVLFENRIGAFGSEAIIKKHSEKDPSQIRHALATDTGPEELLALLEVDRDRIRQLVASVVMRAKDFAGHQWYPGTTNQNLPVIVGGGGRTARFYQSTIMSTHNEFGQARAGVPPYVLCDTPIPNDFDMGCLNRTHFHRFAIAYGLSLPFGERPEVKLPSAVQRPEPPPLRPVTPVGVYDD
jgi:hypothetical protein